MSRSNKETTKQSYEMTAKVFSQNVAHLAPSESIEKFIALLPPQPKIIDIGCGSGRDAKIFTEKGIDVLGVDFSSHLLEIAKEHAPLARFELMDIEKLDLPEASFDGVWAACSLLHISKQEFPSVLKQIHSLLKKEGSLYLTLKKGVGERLEKDTRYDGNPEKFWSYFEEDELRNLIQTAKFKILELTTVEKNDAYQTHQALRVFCRKY